VIVNNVGSNLKAFAMAFSTLFTNVVSAASDSAVTFPDKLPNSRVSSAFTVYVVMFSTRVVVTKPAVVSGAAVVVVVVVVVVTSGAHSGYGVAKTPRYGVLYTHEKLEPLAV
jgi:hypothetical protein